MRLTFTFVMNFMYKCIDGKRKSKDIRETRIKVLSECSTVEETFNIKAKRTDEKYKTNLEGDKENDGELDLRFRSFSTTSTTLYQSE